MAAYMVVGIDPDGQRDVLGVWMARLLADNQPNTRENEFTQNT
jgi:hypothetical protein